MHSNCCKISLQILRLTKYDLSLCKPKESFIATSCVLKPWGYISVTYIKSIFESWTL